MQQLDRGCETDAPVGMIFDGEQTKRCPRRPILEDPQTFLLAFEHYAHYMQGYLPDEGSLLSQGNRFVKYVSIIQRATSEAREVKEQQEKVAAARRQRIAQTATPKHV